LLLNTSYSVQTLPQLLPKIPSDLPKQKCANAEKTIYYID
jgi:hypothetical protein